MSWTPITLAPGTTVLATVSRTTMTLTLQAASLRALGWSDENPNLAVSLGSGEHAGWLRLSVDEEGVTAETNGTGGVVLSLPRSALPDLIVCRASPLTWRSVEGAIEVRLPTVDAVAGSRSTAVKSRRNASVPAGPTAISSGYSDDEPPLGLIAVPDLYKTLHANAWAVGVELAFLSDGNCLVAGKVVSADDVETVVSRAIERASAPRSRAA